MLIESAIFTIIIVAITPLLQKATFAIYVGLQTIALVLCVKFRFGRPGKLIYSEQSNNEWWFHNREKVIETMRVKVYSLQIAPR